MPVAPAAPAPLPGEEKRRLSEKRASASREASSAGLARRLKVALLLSGGVDSSVALRLLLAAGHDVTAFYLQIWFQEYFRNTWSEARSPRAWGAIFFFFLRGGGRPGGQKARAPPRESPFHLSLFLNRSRFPTAF